MTFFNINYLTIDGIGLSGGTTLTIHALFNSQSFSNNCIFFLDNSDYNVVQNTTVITDDHKRNCQVIGFWINDQQFGIVRTAI